MNHYTVQIASSNTQRRFIPTLFNLSVSTHLVTYTPDNRYMRVVKHREKNSPK